MNFRYDLREWVNGLPAYVEKHRLDGVGRYRRYTIEEERTHGLDLNEYGCADAANILYTIGELPQRPSERIEWVKALQEMQDEEHGWWEEETHSHYHTTAHCVAALELFDAQPKYPLTFLKPLLERKNLDKHLDCLDWSINPWRASHDGAGCCAALAITGEAPDEWFDWYFAWLDREVDPYTGFWRKGYTYPAKEWPGLFGSLAAGFHYHFNYEHFRHPLPYPERVIDTALTIFKEQPRIGTTIGFAEIDWVYCLNRATRVTDYRRDEAVAALWEMCGRAVKLVQSPSVQANKTYDDLHAFFGTLCAVAELQRALPGSIRTPKPLKLVLDRRPFI